MVTFGDEVTKILRNLCLHFARHDGQDGKNGKENHATNVTKIPKTKRRKYGMNETYIDNQTFFVFQSMLFFILSHCFLCQPFGLMATLIQLKYGVQNGDMYILHLQGFH